MSEVESKPDRNKRERCEQCGREGVRGFKTYPSDEKTGQWAITVCANENACQKRWRIPTDDEMDHYGL